MTDQSVTLPENEIEGSMLRGDCDADRGIHFQGRAVQEDVVGNDVAMTVGRLLDMHMNAASPIERPDQKSKACGQP